MLGAHAFVDDRQSVYEMVNSNVRDRPMSLSPKLGERCERFTFSSCQNSVSCDKSRKTRHTDLRTMVWVMSRRISLCRNRTWLLPGMKCEDQSENFVGKLQYERCRRGLGGKLWVILVVHRYQCAMRLDWLEVVTRLVRKSALTYINRSQFG